jgi:endonuclease/exonuclease/phosphatase family metal-dependent hydrolase
MSEPEAEPPKSPEGATNDGAMDDTRISALVESNLRGIGDVRLRKHTDADLRRLLCRMTDTALAMAEDLATDALVEAILAEKKRVDKQKKGKTKAEKLRAASTLWHTLAVGLHKQCAALSYVYTQDEELPVVVAEPERLKICSFNALKLRLSDPGKFEDGSSRPTDKNGLLTDGLLLLQHWQALASIMAGFDVVVMQEIPGNEKLREERIMIFLTMLSKGTAEGRTWSYVNSIPSAKAGGNKECHVAFVKSPLTIEKVYTWQSAGVAPNILLDYAPLQILVSDPKRPGFKLCLTSVHLPPGKPSERARQRDAQLKAILKGYWDHVRAEWNLARTTKGAKDAKKTDEVVHIIAGDFNVFPGIVDADAEGTEIERFNLTKNDFVCTIPESAATSVGKMNYDNLLVDATTYKRYLPHGAVMRLVKQQNSAQSQKGLSDHNPVTLTIEFFEQVR